MYIPTPWNFLIVTICMSLAQGTISLKGLTMFSSQYLLPQIRAAAVPVGEESCSCPWVFDVVQNYHS